MKYNWLMTVKKLLVLAALVSVSISFSGFIAKIDAQESFNRDLYFGMRGDPDVMKLQQFLAQHGEYSGPITGNFFSLTREAVKKFQAAQNIIPATGYFGPLARAQANEIPGGLQAQISDLLRQVAALQKQLQASQASPAVPPPASPTPAPIPTPVPPPVVTVGPAITMSGVTAAGLGPTSNRGKTTVDDIGTITFTASSFGAIVLNTIKLNIAGTLASSTTFVSTSTDILLYDPATGLSAAVGAATLSDCSINGSCVLTVPLGSGVNGYVVSPGSSKTFRVRIDSLSHTHAASGGVATSFSVSITNPGDVIYTDGLDASATPGIALPANSVPININTVSYAPGT
jgi:peptidoglycan hydrolase-like protein with peptidoglycan-binding domain